MAWLSISIGQPSLDISLKWTPLSAVRLPAHRDLYDVTDSSWVALRFNLEGSGFNPEKALAFGNI
jgi:hypothetical protein